MSQADRLASHSDLVASWLARPNHVPWRWRSERFARGVDLVRTHLRPITSRDLLVRSYAREHFQYRSDARPEARILLTRDATEVAYALRWLELGEADNAEPLLSWPGLIGSRRPE